MKSSEAEAFRRLRVGKAPMIHEPTLDPGGRDLNREDDGGQDHQHRELEAVLAPGQPRGRRDRRNGHAAGIVSRPAAR